jgi:tetratricopeptide (TPR) repeat protein
MENTDQPDHPLSQGEATAAPSRTVTINFQADLRTGLTLGRIAPGPGGEDLDQQRISRDIIGAMQRALAQPGVALTQTVGDLLAKGDHQAAADAALQGPQAGAYGIQNAALVEALAAIDASTLFAGTASRFRELRLHVAASNTRYDIADGDAGVLLTKDGASSSDRAVWDNVRAIAAKDRGETETALTIWRRLIRDPGSLSAEMRAWTLRNLSLTLPTSSPEAATAAKASADAFLQAGDKREAATSLLHLTHILAFQNPSEIADQLEAMLALVDEEGLVGDELRAGAFHARAKRLAELRQHRQALDAAMAAIALREGMLGVESQLISSLHLAGIEADALGLDEEAQAFRNRALAIELESGSVYFAMVRRLEAQFTTFEPEVAANLMAEADATNNPRTIAAIGVGVITCDPSLNVEVQLGRLERLYARVGQMKGRPGDLALIERAIAETLLKDGQLDRAAIWLRRVLDRGPDDQSSRDRLVQTLWRLEDWSGAALFLKAEIARIGEMPGLLFALGRSLFEAGDLSGAVDAFTRARRLIDDENSDLARNIETLRSRALDLGAPITPPAAVRGSRPLLAEDFHAALEEFGAFISGHKRMALWALEGKDHVWVAAPEQRAQDLLHTYLKAKFGSCISIFEEVAAGPGRIDLLVQLDTGLAVIVELKMCGFGYSSTYAASGEDQIQAYMTARQIHLGYLVVFDARLNDSGNALLSGLDLSKDTIREVLVDMRPRVSKRGSSRPRKGREKAAKVAQLS